MIESSSRRSPTHPRPRVAVKRWTPGSSPVPSSVWSGRGLFITNHTTTRRRATPTMMENRRRGVSVTGSVTRVDDGEGRVGTQSPGPFRREADDDGHVRRHPYTIGDPCGHPDRAGAAGCYLHLPCRVAIEGPDADHRLVSTGDVD